MLIFWSTKENRIVFSAWDIRDKISVVMTESLVGLNVFTGNWKVSVIGSGFGKIDSHKKVAKSALLMEVFTEIGGEGKWVMLFF